MSQEKIHRRRFLADLLFAGGALSAAALLAQGTRTQAGNSRSPSPTPAPPLEVPPQDVKLGGAVCPPQDRPTPPPPPVRQPHTAGAPLPPRLEGDVAVPAPSPSPAKRPKGERP